MATSESTRLLKANDVRELGSRIAFNFEDLKQRCDDYIEQTRTKARQMLLDAEAETERIRKATVAEARTQGFDAGVAAAEAEWDRKLRAKAEQLAAESLDSVLPAMKQTADQMVAERDRWIAHWEAAGVRMSAAIAKRLIRRHIDADPSIVTGMLSEALQLAAGTPHLRLRLNQHDIDLLGGVAEEVVRSMATCKQAEILADNTIDPGGCIIETQHGTIDARIDTMLDKICDELVDGKE